MKYFTPERYVALQDLSTDAAMDAHGNDAHIGSHTALLRLAIAERTQSIASGSAFPRSW